MLVKTALLGLLAAAVASSVDATPLLLAARSNPNGEYAPSTVTCPAPNGTLGFIRDSRNNAVSPQEADYVQRHRTASQQGWQDWLSSSNPGPALDSALPGGVANYTSDLNRLPKVGLALSGGGYRAMIFGSGALQGLDSRNGTAMQRGTGGLLQLASHVAGLSGGSWAVGSHSINNWMTSQQLKDEVWNLGENLVIPEDGKLAFYTEIIADVKGKRDEGFNTGITDYWGLALSRHLLNSTFPDHGDATTWSDIRNATTFINASYPFPVVLADEREPGEVLVYRNTTTWEFTPYEYGSYEPTVQGFIPIDILGTPLTNGTAGNDSMCVAGFENFGWTVGTSSTLFNGLYQMLITNEGDSIIKNALQSIAGAVANDQNDVSVVPNPFMGYRAEDGIILSKQTNITMVDGGEDNQNLPLIPLLQPARGLDMILAIDSSADASDWPNGSALHETSLRYQDNAQFNQVAVPVMPSSNTFINQGLNTRPTFFGCNATSATNAATAANSTVAPIIVYIPNYPWNALSNFSTFQLEYSDNETQLALDAGVDAITMGGVTSGNISWPTCLACVALERSFARSDTPRPDVCSTCLTQYCWDGTVNDTVPTNPYSPPVGTPVFATSNGQVKAAPVYSGGNGSNADSSSGTGSSDGAVSHLSIQFVASSLMAAVAASALVVLIL